MTLSAIYGQVCTWGHERRNPSWSSPWRNLAVSLFILCLLLWTSWLVLCPMSISTLCRVSEFEKTKGIRLDISKQFRSLIFGFHFCIVWIVGKKFVETRDQFLNQQKTNHLINFEYLVWISNSTNSDHISTKQHAVKKVYKKLTATFFNGLPY